MNKIIIIDDDQTILETIRSYLDDKENEVFLVEDGYAGLELIKKNEPDLIITDLIMPGIGGMEILEAVKNMDLPASVIVMTAYDSMESIIKAIQLGAYDCISKPFDKERFNVLVNRALENKINNERLRFATLESSAKFNKENSIIGNSSVMKEVFKMIGSVSTNRVTVLIQGESGTGKELIAKVIHYSGVTKEHPFIAVNCSSLSETLLESELFGHVEGAFTGAIRDKKGKFELAGEGTIFLDEISEISINIQVKLLRVIQEKKIEKVGGEKSIPIKARIIAATNRNLSEMVKSKKFREDLFYRLNVFTITAPPLRDRKGDIPQLIVHFLQKANQELHKNVNKIPYEAMDMLLSHNWVGNVRELENVITQGVVLSRGSVLQKDTLLLSKNPLEENNDIDESLLSLKEVEKNHITLVLKKVNWKLNEATKILGISKTTLYKKIEDYSIPKET